MNLKKHLRDKSIIGFVWLIAGILMMVLSNFILRRFEFGFIFIFLSVIFMFIGASNISIASNLRNIINMAKMNDKLDLYDEVEKGKSLGNIILTENYLVKINKFGAINLFNKKFVEKVTDTEKNIILSVRYKPITSFKTYGTFEEVYSKVADYKIKKVNSDFNCFYEIDSWLKTRRADEVIFENNVFDNNIMDNTVKTINTIKETYSVNDNKSSKNIIIIIALVFVLLGTGGFALIKAFNKKTNTIINTSEDGYTYANLIDDLKNATNNNEYISYFKEVFMPSKGYVNVEYAKNDNGKYVALVDNYSNAGFSGIITFFDTQGNVVHTINAFYIKPFDYQYIKEFEVSAEIDSYEISNEIYFESTFEQPDFDYDAYWTNINSKYTVGVKISEDDLSLENVIKYAKNMYSYNSVSQMGSELIYFYDETVRVNDINGSEEEIAALIENNTKYYAEVNAVELYIKVFEKINGNFELVETIDFTKK